jgi:predicted TIM-barrel fold metal-dependent hydrolase
MVIIDAHTHIFPDAVARRALRTVISNLNNRLTAYTKGTRDSLLASMESAGVDHSIVLTVATSPGHGDGILQWIKELIPISPNLTFFGSIHPEDPEFCDRIREMAEIGLQGIKFHPGYQNFPVDSLKAYAVYEEAIKHDMTMYFHAGYDPSLPGCDYTSVDRYASFVNDFKGSKIVLAHGGGYGEWTKVLDLLGDKGCYFDIAFVLESMKQCADARELFRQNEDFFFFGTDSPWRDQKQYVDLIRNSETLTTEQKEKLFYKNIQKLIKF